MNLRELAGAERPYWQINREERNLVALLYAALLQGDNLLRFLRAVKADLPLEPEEVSAYVEYAYLRDIWAFVGQNKRHEAAGHHEPAEDTGRCCARKLQDDRVERALRRSFEDRH